MTSFLITPFYCYIRYKIYDIIKSNRTHFSGIAFDTKTADRTCTVVTSFTKTGLIVYKIHNICIYIHRGSKSCKIGFLTIVEKFCMQIVKVSSLLFII